MAKHCFGPEPTRPQLTSHFSFQAAWEGDSAKVKSMTLAPWGLEPQCLPLKITTRDSNGFSPFSIAVFRGYLQLAKIIADIAQAQYQPKEDVRKRFNFRPFDSEDTDGSDYDSEVNIDCELVDDDFTIENVGAVANVVKSNITPLQMILSSFPVWRLLQDSIEQAERTVVLQHTEAGVLHSYGSQKPWVSSLPLVDLGVY